VHCQQCANAAHNIPCVLKSTCAPWTTALLPFLPLLPVLLLLVPAVCPSAASSSLMSLSEESDVSDPDMLDTCSSNKQSTAPSVAAGAEQFDA
jgi:hypothetical protein